MNLKRKVKNVAIYLGFNYLSCFFVLTVFLTYIGSLFGFLGACLLFVMSWYLIESSDYLRKHIGVFTSKSGVCLSWKKEQKFLNKMLSSGVQSCLNNSDLQMMIWRWSASVLSEEKNEKGAHVLEDCPGIWDDEELWVELRRKAIIDLAEIGGINSEITFSELIGRPEFKRSANTLTVAFFKKYPGAICFNENIMQWTKRLYKNDFVELLIKKGESTREREFLSNSIGGEGNSFSTVKAKRL